jgi:lipoprotein signal peptidase
MRHRPRILSVGVATAVVVLDQVVKAAATASDASGATVVRNRDVAFGAFGGPAPLLAIGAVVALTLFIGVVVRSATRIGVSPAPGALVAGGLVANVCDRVRLGAVRDFIPTPWAIVNLADLAVFVGMTALVAGFALRAHALHRSSHRIALGVPALGARIVTRRGAVTRDTGGTG